MSDFHEPAGQAPEPPTVCDEKQAHVIHRAEIAALFKGRPLEDIQPGELAAITPHYQQRISECRRLESMRIVNVKQWIVLADGSKKRLDGAYRYEPYEPLGPASDRFRPQKLMF